MRITLSWVFLHGGIESVWRGAYSPRKGVAVGRFLESRRNETINVRREDRFVFVSGGSLDGEQQGTVWREAKDMLEIELFAGS